MRRVLFSFLPALMLVLPVGTVARAEHVRGTIVDRTPASGPADSVTIEVVEDGATWQKTLDVTKLPPEFRNAVAQDDWVRIRYRCRADCAATSGWIRDAGESGREPFQADVYVGYAIDTFAADELNRYLNPESSGDVKERWVGGFDFAYRLRQLPAGRGLWIYGETVHGVRSADVDCSENPSLALCDDFDPMGAPETALYLLRNATSLEALAGLRYEFATLNRGTGHRGAFYTNVQFGFLAVADNADDLADSHHAGVGVRLTEGRFGESYLEVGRGVNDLFEMNSRKRWKLDGFLTWRPSYLEKLSVQPFAQITLDSDFSDGTDSVQSYIGFSFDADGMFGRDSKKAGE